MYISYSDFIKIKKNIKYKYINTGLPFAGVRIFSIDANGIEHSIVLTKQEYIKYFDKYSYSKKFITDNKPGVRLTNIHPWQEYDQYQELQDKLRVKDLGFMDGLFK